MISFESAQRLMDAGRYRVAVSHYAALYKRKRDIRALVGVASSLTESGQHLRALTQILKVIKKRPQLYTAYALKGRINARLRRYQEAIQDFRRAARLKAKDSAAANSSPPLHLVIHNLEQLQYLKSHRLWRSSQSVDLHVISETLDRLRRVARNRKTIPAVTLNGSTTSPILSPPFVTIRTQTAAKLNPNLDFRKIENSYLHSVPRAVVVDDFLAESTKSALWQFCLRSTCWRQPFRDGYVGAFPQDGFASEIIFNIADQLKSSMPRILANCFLSYWWAFVYDSNYKGIDFHADNADVSINLWLTPDSANLLPQSGGLVISTQRVPQGWSFSDYNGDKKAIRHLLAGKNTEYLNIPHQSNRAVLFDGYLFHKTAPLRFRPGFLNRRRNLTILFRRQR